MTLGELLLVCNRALQSGRSLDDEVRCLTDISSPAGLNVPISALYFCPQVSVNHLFSPKRDGI